jgi:hypothetical protein
MEVLDRDHKYTYGAMIGEEVLSGVINGFFQRHQIGKWARLILSCAGSAFCTQASLWGAGTLPHLASGQALLLALTFGFADLLIATSAVVWNVWRRSPLTKNIPIAAPRSVEQAEIKILKEQGMVTDEGKK